MNNDTPSHHHHHQQHQQHQHQQHQQHQHQQHQQHPQHYYSIVKIFQASPLAYEDWKGKVNPIPSLDLDAEQTMLTEALKGTHIRPVFETATAQRLGTFLSQQGNSSSSSSSSSNQFLHFSCHGHPGFLFLEDDRGGAQALPTTGDTLQEWIRAGVGRGGGGGGGGLSIVFVSACHSRPAGECFVRAGARHVVCCEQADQSMSNTAAMIFARQFYVSLANGTTVRQAFDLAIHMVRQAPEMKRTGLNVDQEASKFALLPEDADHDVSPFFKQGSEIQDHRGGSLKSSGGASSLVRPSTTTTTTRHFHALLPIPPTIFLGRELDMYRIINALLLQKARLVRLQGPPGIGKDALALAVGHFMARRHMWGDFVVWLPLVRRGTTMAMMATTGDSDDPHHSAWMEVLENMVQFLETTNVPANVLSSNTDYRKLSHTLMDHLYDLKAILVINTTRGHFSGSSSSSSSTQATIQRLGVLVNHVLERTKNIKFLTVEQDDTTPTTSTITTSTTLQSQTIMVEPLSFDATVALFGRICPHAVQDPKSWNVASSVKHWINSPLTWKLLGNGIPAKTIFIAKTIDKNDYLAWLDASSSSKDPAAPDALLHQQVDFAQLLDRVDQQQEAFARTSSTKTTTTTSQDTITATSSSIVQSRSTKEDQEDHPGDMPNIAPHYRRRPPPPPLRSQLEVQNHFRGLLQKEGKVYRKCASSYIRRAKRGERIVTTIDGKQESENVVRDDTSWVVCGKAAGEYYVLTHANFQDCYDASSVRPIVVDDLKVNNHQKIRQQQQQQQQQQTNTAPIFRRLHQLGFQEYKSKRQVWARRVTEEDMAWFRHRRPYPYSSSSEDKKSDGGSGSGSGDDVDKQDADNEAAYFVAPWGESMRLEQGDYLVMPYPDGGTAVGHSNNSNNNKHSDEIYRVEHIVFGYSYEPSVDGTIIHQQHDWGDTTTMSSTVLKVGAVAAAIMSVGLAARSWSWWWWWWWWPKANSNKR